MESRTNLDWDPDYADDLENIAHVGPVFFPLATGVASIVSGMMLYNVPEPILDYQSLVYTGLALVGISGLIAGCSYIYSELKTKLSQKQSSP